MLFRSIGKSIRLRKLSKILGKSALSGRIDLEDMLSGRERKEEALHKLILMAFEEPVLVKIINDHEFDREALKEIYHLLKANGAGQWVKGHYVPASTFVYAVPLEMCLKGVRDPNIGLMDIAYMLVNYFD